jgi:hypothetical protein
VRGYRFLVDRDVSKIAEQLPRKRTLTLDDVGLPENATDPQIVEAAYERRCIIVTANREHFVAEMERFMRVQKRKQCYDLSGLIVLPSGYEHQKRLWADAEDRLHFGGRKLTWHDIWYKDYLVRLRKSGVHEIKPFPPCRYCREQSV